MIHVANLNLFKEECLWQEIIQNIFLMEKNIAKED